MISGPIPIGGLLNADFPVNNHDRMEIDVVSRWKSKNRVQINGEWSQSNN